MAVSDPNTGGFHATLLVRWMLVFVSSSGPFQVSLNFCDWKRGDVKRRMGLFPSGQFPQPDASRRSLGMVKELDLSL